MIRTEVGKHISYQQCTGARKNNEGIGDVFGRHGFLTTRVRRAIDLICVKLGLSNDDEVYITTTFGSHYVSSCVTCTVFNYCKPSKVLSDKSKAVFVIHEFGVPHAETLDLLKMANNRGIPLIEDCAHSMNSYLDGHRIGSIGDYAIYSLPKVLAIPYGGILLGNIDDNYSEKTRLEKESLARIEFSLEKHLGKLKEYSDKRRTNYNYLSQEIKKIGMVPLFKLDENVSPYAFPFFSDQKDETIKLFTENNIECFGWRGGEIVVLPVHQCLNLADLDGFVTLLHEINRSRR